MHNALLRVEYTGQYSTYCSLFSQLAGTDSLILQGASVNVSSVSMSEANPGCIPSNHSAEAAAVPNTALRVTSLVAALAVVLVRNDVVNIGDWNPDIAPT